jgi:septal ring factor EnvC (AmiA/AmiB activator)
MKIETANPVPTADTPLMELAALAIKSRDTYKLDAQQARTQQQQTQLDSDRLRVEIERLNAQIVRLTAELEESESNNSMLQKMLKRILKDTRQT